MRTYVVPIRRQVLDDGGVYREVYGDDGAETVVLVHGAGGTHVVWWQQLVPLCEAGFRVVAVDLPGFGNTPGPFDLDRCAAAVGHVLDRPSHLVGQSLGGWVVSAVAIARPDDVRSALYSATPGGISAARDIAFSSRSRPPDPEVLGDHPANGPNTSPALAVLYQQLGTLAPSPPRRDIGVALTQTWFDAAAITCPARFVSGSADAVFPPAAIAAAAAATGAEHVLLDGCGHSPYFEDAPAWNAVALTWLENPSSPAQEAGPELGDEDSNPE